MKSRFVVLPLTAVLLVAFSSVPLGAGEVVGLQPDRRPEAAPVVSDYLKDGAWYRAALTGIDQPYPASLRFLEDQGAWFSPFIHPGMLGPYDIRGWHSREKPASP